MQISQHSSVNLISLWLLRSVNIIEMPAYGVCLVFPEDSAALLSNIIWALHYVPTIVASSIVVVYGSG